MEIQDVLKALGDTGCLLLWYCRLANIKIEDLIDNFNILVEVDAIRPDCYVLDANKLLKFFEKQMTVEKVDVKDVPEGQEYVVPYHRNGYTHFVVARDGKVIYNTLANSKCVKYGKPDNIVRVVKGE